MAPASDNNNQDLATKKAKLESTTVIGGVGKLYLNLCFL
jgi:polypyrimidine tract-binding protein 1